MTQRIKVFNEPALNDQLSVYIQEETTSSYLQAYLTWQTVPEGQRYEPTMYLHKTEAQVLMDCLWHAGIRPTEGSGSAGSLAATQAHLEDLRSILATKLEIPLLFKSR